MLAVACVLLQLLLLICQHSPSSAGVLRCVVVCCGVLRRVAVCCKVLRRVAVCCSALQYVAVRCSMLQYVTVCCSELQYTYRQRGLKAHINSPPTAMEKEHRRYAKGNQETKCRVLLAGP